MVVGLFEVVRIVRCMDVPIPERTYQLVNAIRSPCLLSSGMAEFTRRGLGTLWEHFVLNEIHAPKRGISCIGGINGGKRWTGWWRRDAVSRWPLSARGGRNVSTPRVFLHSDVNIPKEKISSSSKMSPVRTPVASAI